MFGSSVLYPASDLSYTVPTMYLANPELMRVNNGKIVLGGEFFYPEDLYKELPGDSAQKNKFLIRAMATRVVPQKLDPSLFVAPAGFKEWTYDYGVDSTAMILDSSVVAPVKPPAKNKKKQPAKKGTSTKESATRRKND